MMIMIYNFCFVKKTISLNIFGHYHLNSFLLAQLCTLIPYFCLFYLNPCLLVYFMKQCSILCLLFFIRKLTWEENISIEKIPHSHVEQFFNLSMMQNALTFYMTTLVSAVRCIRNQAEKNHSMISGSFHVSRSLPSLPSMMDSSPQNITNVFFPWLLLVLVSSMQ